MHGGGTIKPRVLNNILKNHEKSKRRQKNIREENTVIVIDRKRKQNEAITAEKPISISPHPYVLRSITNTITNFIIDSIDWTKPVSPSAY